MRDTTPRPFVFVLMPFVKEFDDVYKLGIKPAYEKAGAYAERVDEQIFQESILQRIYNQVAKADVIGLLIALTKSNRFYRVFSGERYSFKIKYRFQVLVPKRQILPCAVMRIIRSALTCLSVPFTTSLIPTKYLIENEVRV